MNVGSLFSGIGGLDLGLERAGMTVRWQSEIDPYCCRVLAKHWPDVPNLGDVTQIDWSQVEPVDLIAGGYPCQPFSLAGARQGEQDARHLWPRFRDAIRHLRPRWVLLENVPGHLSLGFGSVLGDLAELGYDCEWDCIPAAAVGAPHLRYRVFVVAYPNVYEHEGGASANGRTATSQLPAHTDGESESGVTVDALQGSGFMVPDTDGDTIRQQPVGLRRGGGASLVAVDGVDRDVADTSSVTEREQADEANTVTARGETRTLTSCGSWWSVEPNVGRVAHGVPHRVDRLRALGNAVVPQVAELIGRRILEVAA